MEFNNCKEWYLELPWGKLAVASWGNPEDPPILLVHGYMDTLATFQPLLEVVPKGYFYVSFDIPGHGKSDKYPEGLLPTHAGAVYVIRRIVNDLGWKRFIFIGHSVGSLTGVFYNAAHPGEIHKLIAIDMTPPLAQYYINTIPKRFYDFLYDEYYGKYYKVCNYSEPKHMTLDEAVGSIMKNRKTNRKQSEDLLSRALVPVDDGKFIFSWDAKMKRFANTGVTKDNIIHMLKNLPPSLIFVCSITIARKEAKPWADEIIKEVRQSTKNFKVLEVEGDHDVHITNPERISGHIKEFIDKELNVIKYAKL